MQRGTGNFNFSNLSLSDLIEAREMFHVHLMNKKNVVATAIGRYRVRLSDLDENGQYVPKHKEEPRTLQNSVVVKISWPCILVFVDTWQKSKDLLQDNAVNIIPKTIYMPDGRMVPICVVMAEKQHVETTDIDIRKLSFPRNYIGGGFPMIVHNQGLDHYASVGCLVSDGHNYYALTNQHVTGADAGTKIETQMGDQRMAIGESSGLSLGKVPFSKLYPGWDYANMQVSCDVGLVDIYDLNRWKTDVIGVKAMGEIYDLNTMSMSLDLVAEHKVEHEKIEDSINGNVSAYGAVSGRMKGEIAALFYRYKSLGGVEYVSDFLIGGRCGTQLNVHYGDSGTLWLLENQDEDDKTIYQPIALHWGQHQFLEGARKQEFAFSLATCLSNICRELDVELSRGWNVDVDFSWGKVGHYTIGTETMLAINNVNLKELMTANQENVSFRETDVNKDLDSKDNPALEADPDKGFCPLADVPDIVWKQSKIGKGGVPIAWGRKGDENPNHYADADAPTLNNGGTLYDRCDSVDKMTVDVWKQYYDEIDKAAIGIKPENEISHGLVCFRVWQIFKYMTEAATNGDAARFVFAAGVLAHYVGDACQPLHSSYMSDGNPADTTSVDYVAKVTSHHKDGSVSHQKGDHFPKDVNPGSGVHVAYEDHMIDDFINLMLPEIHNRLSDTNSRISKEAVPQITTGQEAAFATLQLMKLTQADIHPIDIVEAFKAAKGQANVSEALHTQFGDPTIDCMARGCRYLAAIWDGAWAAGNGDANIADLSTIDQPALIALYREPTELPSKSLETVESEL